MLLLRAVAVAATILPLLAWLPLPWLPIRRVRLIRILWRALLALATAAGMLLVLLMLLMLIAVGRWWPLRLPAPAGAIGRHAALTTTRGWILMGPL